MSGFIKIIKHHELAPSSHLAAGKAANTLPQLLRSLLRFASSQGIHLHFFGLHALAFRQFHSHPNFAGADTGAHALDYKYKHRTRLKCNSLGEACYLRALAFQIKRLFPFLSLHSLLEHSSNS